MKVVEAARIMTYDGRVASDAAAATLDDLEQIDVLFGVTTCREVRQDGF